MIKFLKKHTWILVIIMIVITFPQALSTQSELNLRVLVTGIAIDKKDDNFLVTAQIVMPKAGSESGGGGAQLDFVTEEGLTMAETVNKVAFKIGKTLGLSHLSFIIVGENMLDDNLITHLDYFIRSRSINSSLMVAVCEGSAKDMIKNTKNLEVSTGVNMRKIFLHKQNSSNGIMMPLEELYNEFYNPSSSCLVSYITVGNEEKRSQESSGSASSGASSESGSSSDSGSSAGSNSSQSQQKGRIDYLNKIACVSNGKVVGNLENEQAILGALFVNNNCHEGYLSIENVEGDLYQGGNVGIYYKNKKTKLITSFVDNVPKAVFNVSLTIFDYEEINSLNNDLTLFDSYSHRLTPELKQAISNTVINAVCLAFETAKTFNADIFNIANKMFRLNFPDFSHYKKEKGLATLLKEIDFSVTVNIESAL